MGTMTRKISSTSTATRKQKRPLPPASFTAAKDGGNAAADCRGVVGTLDTGDNGALGGADDSDSVEGRGGG